MAEALNSSAMTKAQFSHLTGLSGLQSRRKGGYQALLAQINEHAWYLAEQRQATVDLTDAAQHWHDKVFMPVIQQLEARGVLQRNASKAPADLYLSVCDQKWTLSEQAGQDVGFEPAIDAITGEDAAPSKPARARKSA